MATTTQVDKVYTCRCNNFTFQVLVMLFLPISMSMALSSFHKFLAFGLPNRSPAKLSFDLISEGIHLSSHILIKLGVLIMDFRRVIGPRDARMESLENLKSFHDFFLFPVSLIRGKTEPEQFENYRYGQRGTASRDVGVFNLEPRGLTTNIVWEHPSGQNWMRSYFL